MIDLNPNHLATVRRILAEHAPGCEVRAFGSRAKWTATEYSDLDLAIVGQTELDSETIWRLKEAFSESDLPILVDVLDWHAISDSFRELIEQDCVELMSAAQSKQDAAEMSSVRLSDVATIVMGQSPPGSTYNEDGVGLPFFQGVRDFTYRHPTPRVYCSEPSRIAQVGDILLSVRAPIGRVNVADRECATGRGIAIIKPNAESDARYLEFALRSLERTWDSIEGSGSVFGNATRRDLESLLLPWPDSAAERGRIAGVLGALDDKIELNRRTSRTLEEIANALFRSWFVDFEPVRAKQAQRWSPGQSLPGLPAHLHPLFPDHLEPSPIGPIPAGWHPAPLDEIATFLNGLALQKFPAQGPESLPAIKIAQLRAGHTGRADLVSPDIPSDYVIDDGDILFSWSGSLELVVWAGGKGALNQHLFKVDPVDFPKWFVYHWVKRHLPEFRQIAADKATTMGHIKRHHLTDALVAAPPPALLAELDHLMAPPLAQANAARVASRRLAEMRDRLLAALLADPRSVPGSLVAHGPAEIQSAGVLS